MVALKRVAASVEKTSEAAEDPCSVAGPAQAAWPLRAGWAAPYSPATAAATAAPSPDRVNQSRLEVPTLLEKILLHYYSNCNEVNLWLKY